MATKQKLTNPPKNSMIIAAAFCLIGAHPGFVFKNGAGQRSLEEEEKSAEEQTQEQKPTTSETSVSP